MARPRMILEEVERNGLAEVSTGVAVGVRPGDGDTWVEAVLDRKLKDTIGVDLRKRSVSSTHA